MYTKAKDISLVLEDRPGILAKVTEALATAGVNIDGFSGASECDSTFHFLFIKDADKARRAIEAGGWKVKQERDVALVDVEDRPGTAAAELKKISQQELNVDLLYLATHNRMVIGGQEFPRIWEALSGETQKVAR
ncbi:MAG: ACT domain-containing protein [Candidatus Limnocylindria bacterium]